MAQRFIVVLVLVDLPQGWRKIFGQRQANQDRPGLSRWRRGHKIFGILIDPFFWRLLKPFQVGKGLTKRRPRTWQVPAGHGVVITKRQREAVLQHVLMAAKFMQYAAVIGGLKSMLNFRRLRDIHCGMACAVSL